MLVISAQRLGVCVNRRSKVCNCPFPNSFEIILLLSHSMFVTVKLTDAPPVSGWDALSAWGPCALPPCSAWGHLPSRKLDYCPENTSKAETCGSTAASPAASPGPERCCCFTGTRNVARRDRVATARRYQNGGDMHSER